MIDALRYEWVRITTIRSTYWLTGLAVLLSATIGSLIAYFSADANGGSVSTDMASGVLTGGAEFAMPFVPLFMGIIGAFAFGHEYRHNMILPTLTAVNRRANLVLAKVLVIAGWSLVITVVSVGLNWALGSALAGSSVPLTEDPVGGAMLGYLGYSVLWGLLGLGLSGLLRNLPGTLVILIVTPMVAEPILIGVLSVIEGSTPAIASYLPFSAGIAMIATFDLAGAGGMAVADSPERWVSSLVFAAWTAAVIAPAWALFHKRDA